MIMTFKDLAVWQRAMELVCVVYRLTRRMPETERFGLTNQLRRRAMSIPSNIVEGNARQGRKDYLNFLTIARGSLGELETQLLLAFKLQMLPDVDAALRLVTETQRILQGLIQSLRHRDKTNQPRAKEP